MLPLVTIRHRASSTKLRLPMNRAEALLQVASASDPSILRRADLGLYRLLVSAGLLKDLDDHPSLPLLVLVTFHHLHQVQWVPPVLPHSHHVLPAWVPHRLDSKACLRFPRARPLSPPTVQTPVHPKVDLPSPLLTLVGLVGLVHLLHLILAVVLLHLLVTRDPLQTVLHLQAVPLCLLDPVECTLTDCV